MLRSDIINAIIEKNGYTRYLEIGIRNPGDNFDLIKAQYKIGVDPRADVARPDMFKMTSDEFFVMLINPGPFDLVFVDGLHTDEQSYRDVRNAFKNLNPGGCVVMHDCYPQSEEAAMPEKPDNGRAWNGTVYRTFLKFRTMKSYDCCCVNADHGVGIIRKRKGAPASIPASYDWRTFANNAAEWLALVPPADLAKVL